MIDALSLMAAAGQDGPRDTSVYMFAAYGLIAGILLLYIVHLIKRRRKAEEE